MKALILMTRIPIPGKTKTRLMKILSANECAEIHKAFLLDIFNVYEHIKEDVDIYLTYTPGDCFDLMKDIIPSYIDCFPQIGEDLGERMLNSMANIFSKEYSKVVLMGCDIPQIQPKHIVEAFNLLESNEVCLCPTFDGGYYLVGMSELYPQIFSNNLKWGNKSVLEGTLDICNRLGINVALGHKCRDIDTKEDFMYLTEEIKKGEFERSIECLNTKKFTENYWRKDKSAKSYIGK
ncbi:MAG: TIGR04282 family arsenosugar biosynthesis glycosyltransferase [Clostridiaceae bacterium]